MANISRRSFLATSAAAAAVATVPAIAMAGDNPTYDVIVIGGGGAGLSAAIEASDAGASVLVLEKNTVTGGTTSTSQGLIGGFGTQIQKAQGVELTYEQMYDNLNGNASYRLDPELMGITVAKSGESIDWLIDRCAVPFKSEAVVGYGPLTMMHVVEGAGSVLTDTLLAAAEEAGVEIVTEAKATEITMENGAPVSVKTEDGSIYGCKALVIATGGYAYNPELAKRFTP